MEPPRDSVTRTVDPSGIRIGMRSLPFALLTVAWLASSCASGTRSEAAPEELEQEGHVAATAQQYIVTLRTDTSQAAQRRRLKEAGKRAIAIDLAEADTLEALGCTLPQRTRCARRMA